MAVVIIGWAVREVEEGDGIEKNKRADKTKRRKERKGREITEERDKEEEMFITQRLELRPFQTNR